MQKSSSILSKTNRYRAGSPKKTIFLSQFGSGRRFDYMETDKSKSTVKEITGKIARHYSHKELPGHSPYETVDVKGMQGISGSSNTSSRSLKVCVIPPSKRVLDFSLQSEVKMFQNKSRPSSVNGRKYSEKNLLTDSTTIQSLTLKTDSEAQFLQNGRKHNPNMYKSFTFDVLSQQLFTDKYDKKLRPAKKMVDHRTNEKFLPPQQEARKENLTKNSGGCGWKNGHWDLNNPYTPRSNALLLTTNRSYVTETNNSYGANTVNTVQTTKEKASKYVPISRNAGANRVSFFGKTNLQKVLNIGVDSHRKAF